MRQKSAEAFCLRACKSLLAVTSFQNPSLPGKGLPLPFTSPVGSARRAVRKLESLAPLLDSQDGFQDGILDPIIILASISDQLFIDFRWFFDDFSQIFGRFWVCFGVHFCTQCLHQFLMILSMLFLSKIQMCCSAETLEILILHWFLQCFVKVALLRNRQSKH